MRGKWVCVAAAVVVAAFGGRCESRGIRPSLVGLLNAEEINKQIDLIETLVEKLVNGSDCANLKQKIKEEEEEEATEEGSGMKSRKKGTTEPESEDEGEEQCDYAKLSKSHTMLLPPKVGCTVHKTGITKQERDLILDFHNKLRAKVAQGNESQGDPGPQPPAANMHQLVWNEELAKVAQAWASQCPTGHDKERNRRICSRKYRTGQNINYFWGVFDQGPNWQEAIENWYNEVKDVGSEVAASFRPHKTKKIGHYTQVIWGTTKEIGCGIVYYETIHNGITYNHSITYVCNYGPAGNMLNRPFYEHGPATSKCPSNSSMKYLDLCL